MIVTVSQLDSYIKGIFDAEELLHGISVTGEVSGYSVKSDNAYFTLKDAVAQLNCCCFRVSKTFSPKNGDEVILTGRPDFYMKTGKLSFLAEKIEPKGIGALFRGFLELKARLEAEGLFREERKIPLPRLVKELCIVTSLQGAVVQDILSTIYQTTDQMRITVVDTRVQGVGAVESIVNALATADRKGFDALILARGGGSFEDLMPFNTEEVARAVAATVTPIISAVGHETDFSLSDFAADRRALTPTAAAELVTDGWKSRKNEFSALKNRLVLSVNNMLRRASDNLRSEKTRLDFCLGSAIDRKENEFRLLRERLRAVDPAAALKKGYIAVEKEGKRVFTLGELRENDLVTLAFPDGTARARIEEKTERNEELSNGF